MPLNNRFFGLAWRYTAFLALLFGLNSCGIYSFSGTNISPDVKTISIQNFVNISGGGPANLQQTFSEKTRDYFQKNTRLGVVQQGGDLQMEGSIVGYELSPLPPSSNDQASQTRLTMKVKVAYTNTQDNLQNFDEVFSFYADFPSNQTLTSVEPDLINTISDQIILQLFNKSVANW
jgi:hypothetical protein